MISKYTLLTNSTDPGIKYEGRLDLTETFDRQGSGIGDGVMLALKLRKKRAAGL